MDRRAPASNHASGPDSPVLAAAIVAAVGRAALALARAAVDALALHVTATFVVGRSGRGCARDQPERSARDQKASNLHVRSSLSCIAVGTGPVRPDAAMRLECQCIPRLQSAEQVIDNGLCLIQLGGIGPGGIQKHVDPC